LTAATEDCLSRTIAGFEFETVDVSALMASPANPEVIEAVGKLLGPALQETGFAIIVGHGIPAATFEMGASECNLD
jgi:isopenicillin N synthase-like dioxygenase